VVSALPGGCRLSNSREPLYHIGWGWFAMNTADHNPTTHMGQQLTVSAGPRIRIAFLLALLADALQIAILPLFVEGAESPAADAVDVIMAAVLYLLLGWHWEFLPSFLGKLVPGVDLVPLWTFAVANVYRKSKGAVVIPGNTRPAR
jgi:hypothetical protein